MPDAYFVAAVLAMAVTAPHVDPKKKPPEPGDFVPFFKVPVKQSGREMAARMRMFAAGMEAKGLI